MLEVPEGRLHFVSRGSGNPPLMFEAPDAITAVIEEFRRRL